MYTIDITTKKSAIDGKGVFTLEPVKKGTVVWKYIPEHDIKITEQEYEQLSSEDKEEFDHSAYLSPWTGYWVCPPPGDAARYTNHSPRNNLTVVFDDEVSPEPFFIANRDIASGEELTNNYLEFDQITRDTKPIWAK